MEVRVVRVVLLLLLLLFLLLVVYERRDLSWPGRLTPQVSLTFQPVTRCGLTHHQGKLTGGVGDIVVRAGGGGGGVGGGVHQRPGTARSPLHDQQKHRHHAGHAHHHQVGAHNGTCRRKKITSSQGMKDLH